MIIKKSKDRFKIAGPREEILAFSAQFIGSGKTIKEWLNSPDNA